MAQKIARQMTRQMTMCSSDRPTNTARPTRPPTTKKQRQQRQRIKKQQQQTTPMSGQETYNVPSAAITRTAPK
jgi:hypothetical protein